MRVLHAAAHGRDCCYFAIGGFAHNGYVPKDIEIGDSSGDDLALNLCLDCGQAQGTWPHPPIALEKGTKP